MKALFLKLRKSLIILTVGIVAISGQAQETFRMKTLPYAYDALEPRIDARTMEIHYSKHYAGYTSNLNKALASLDRSIPEDIEDILKNISEYPDAVRNNAGGYYNHGLYWYNITPDTGTKLSEAFQKTVNEDFEDKQKLEEKLLDASAKRFGSGWVWLIVTPDNKLIVTSTPNQDNPLMDVAETNGIPILGIDVWEHAYYLHYQNRRGDYAKAFMEIINWEEVSRRYEDAVKKQ